MLNCNQSRIRKPGRRGPPRLGGLALCAGLASLLAGCAREASQRVTVIGTDYAFELPAGLAAGRTELAFENRGLVDHEMILVRLREGVTLEDALEVGRTGGDFDTVLEPGAGILIAGPGETPSTRLLADLERGTTYALVCNFQDTPEAPPHTALGMATSFMVE